MPHIPHPLVADFQSDVNQFEDDINGFPSDQPIGQSTWRDLLRRHALILTKGQTIVSTPGVLDNQEAWIYFWVITDGLGTALWRARERVGTSTG
jgi:hypothetical protein